MMSRYPRRFACLSLPVLAGLLLAILLTLPLPARAGVIAVERSTYRLDGGKPVTGMWEIAERIAYAKDVAIVVMEPTTTPPQSRTCSNCSKTSRCRPCCSNGPITRPWSSAES
jgi:hypothetical protein